MPQPPLFMAIAGGPPLGGGGGICIGGGGGTNCIGGAIGGIAIGGIPGGSAVGGICKGGAGGITIGGGTAGGDPVCRSMAPRSRWDWRVAVPQVICVMLRFCSCRQAFSR